MSCATRHMLPRRLPPAPAALRARKAAGRWRPPRLSACRRADLRRAAAAQGAVVRTSVLAGAFLMLVAGAVCVSATEMDGPVHYGPEEIKRSSDRIESVDIETLHAPIRPNRASNDGGAGRRRRRVARDAGDAGSGYDLTPMSRRALRAAKKKLTNFQNWVLFDAGTERPHTNKYARHKARGVYVSAVSGVPLFRSDDKYDSGSGWPSFTRPFHAAHVVEREDDDGSGRVEVIDAKSGTHLGHVFDDGPGPREGGTGMRYCINSAAVRFVPDSAHARAHAEKGHAPGSQARETETQEQREL